MWRNIGVLTRSKASQITTSPRGTPPAIVERLSREVVVTVQASYARERLTIAGVELYGNARNPQSVGRQ